MLLTRKVNIHQFNPEIQWIQTIYERCCICSWNQIIDLCVGLHLLHLSWSSSHNKTNSFTKWGLLKYFFEYYINHLHFTSTVLLSFQCNFPFYMFIILQNSPGQKYFISQASLKFNLSSHQIWAHIKNATIFSWRWGRKERKPTRGKKKRKNSQTPNSKKYSPNCPN